MPERIIEIVFASFLPACFGEEPCIGSKIATLLSKFILALGTIPSVLTNYSI